MLVKQITDFNQAITFAQLPSPTGLTGKRFYLTDLQLAVISNGSIWLPDGAQVLTLYNSTFTFSGSATAQTYHSYTLPGGLLHANAVLRLTFAGGRTGSTNGTVEITLGGTTLTNFTVNNRSSHTYRIITLTNSLSASKSMMPAASGLNQFTTSGSAPTTFTANFANNVQFLWRLTPGNTTDSVFGDFASLEWLR